MVYEVNRYSSILKKMELDNLVPLHPIDMGASSSTSVPDPAITTSMLVGIQYVINLKNPDEEPNSNSFLNKVAMPLRFAVCRLLPKSHPKVKEEFTKLLHTYLTSVGNDIKNVNSSSEVIDYYTNKWRLFKIMIGVLKMTLGSIYLDRTRILVLPEAIIREQCYKEWYEQLLIPNNDVLSESIHKLMIEYRESVLSGEPSIHTKSIIKQIVNCYQELDPTLEKEYATSWSTPFLEHTRTYYESVCNNFLQNNSITDYIHHCNKMLDLEQVISDEFIVGDTVDKHKEIINEVIIIKYKDEMQQEVNNYITNNMLTELKYIFRLFESTDIISTLVQIFIDEYTKSLKAAFEHILPQLNKQEHKKTFPTTYCKAFLDTYNHYLDIINSCFNNIKFNYELEKVSRDLLNDNQINKKEDPAELTAVFAAVYTNEVISDVKIMINEFNETHLPNIMVLYNTLCSKDVFCKRYKASLMVRLLKGLQNQDSDIALINSLKSKDVSFANTLCVMLNDYNQSFERYGSTSGFITKPLPIQLAPFVLTSTFWPLSNTDKTISMKLPVELQNISEVFCNRFSELNNGKQIIYIHEKSNVLLSVVINGKTYRITMNHFQAAVMLTLVKKPIMTQLQLCNVLELQMDWIEATLKSLSTARLVDQNAKTKQWRISPKFSSPRPVLNASVLFSRPVVDDVVDKEIEEDRGYNTQAAIVRIMKTRRVLDHNTLCEEVTKQTSRFYPQNIERIRKHIDKLINGQEKFIERLDNKTYKYVTE